jgi:hypothetical protein
MTSTYRVLKKCSRALLRGFRYSGVLVSGFCHSGLRQGRGGLLHAVDEIDGRRWGQDQPAGWIPPTRYRRVRLHLVDA